MAPVLDSVTDRVLGLDGGGTKTDAVVADRSGTVVDRRHGGGLDPTAGDGWVARLGAMVAGPGAGSGLGPVAAAVLGLPFHGEIAGVTAHQIAAGTALFGPGCVVLNDVAVAFEGALGGADGVLVLAGTGSMAWSRGRLGTHRTGGWGEAFGDEGSAFWIGREALGLVSRQLDGRAPRTGFADGLLRRLGLDGDGLIAWTYDPANRRAGIAGVAAQVSALAQDGDAEAGAVMARAADCLAELALAAGRLCGAAAPLRWSHAGGVMRDPTVRATLAARLGCAPVAPVLPPVGGAVLAAARAAGWTINEGFIARLSGGLTDHSNAPLGPVDRVIP